MITDPGDTMISTDYNQLYVSLPSIRLLILPRSRLTRYYAEQLRKRDLLQAMKLLSALDSREAMAGIHLLYSPPRPPRSPRNITRLSACSLPRKSVSLRRTCELGARQARLRGD